MEFKVKLKCSFDILKRRWSYLKYLNIEFYLCPNIFYLFFFIVPHSSSAPVGRVAPSINFIGITGGLSATGQWTRMTRPIWSVRYVRRGPVDLKRKTRCFVFLTSKLNTYTCAHVANGLYNVGCRIDKCLSFTRKHFMPVIVCLVYRIFRRFLRKIDYPTFFFFFSYA